MKERTVIAKCIVGGRTLPAAKGTWKPATVLAPGASFGTPGAVEAGRRSANMSCPKCGTMVSLVEHGISDLGFVNPSVVCPNEACDFHEWVRLEGWMKT